MTMDADYQKGLMKEHLNLERANLKGLSSGLNIQNPL